MNDLPVGRSVDETLRLVQAFQYTGKFSNKLIIDLTTNVIASLLDQHGEVCPAGWKPGGATVICCKIDEVNNF